MATPTPVQHVLGPQSNLSPSQDSLTDYIIQLPNPVGANNCVIVSVTHDDGSSATESVTDDKGNTYTSINRVHDTTRGQFANVFRCIGATAGALKITVSFSVATIAIWGAATEFYNVATASADDGNNGAFSSGTTVQPGSITPTTSGDLLYQVMFNDGAGVPATAYTPGSQANITWKLLSAEAVVGTCIQYGVYTSTSAINAQLTIAPTSNWISICIALKSASAGTAPAAGIHVNAVHHNNTYNETAATVSFFLPVNVNGNTNLLVIVFISSSSRTISSISDGVNTWLQAGSGISSGSTIQIFYAANATGTAMLTVACTMSGSNGGGHGETFMTYDASGAASSPLDTTSSASGTQATGTSGNVTADTYTPTVANTLVFSGWGISFDTATGITTTGSNFISIRSTGELEPSNEDENNGWSINYSPNTSAIVNVWTHDAIDFPGVGGWAGYSAGFKPPAAITVVVDDTDQQEQRFTSSARVEGQHQQEISDTFAIPPQRPPFAFEDDGQHMRWSDWRALQYEEVDVHRALPPTPPVSIQEEHTEQLNVTWSARQYDDTETQRALPPTPPVSIEDDAERQKNADWRALQYDEVETQRALPPTPPFAIVDEISERPLPGVTPFVEEDQPGIPIIAAPVPKMGLEDDVQKFSGWTASAYDHIAETDEPGGLGAPPFAIQDAEDTLNRDWRAFLHDDTDTNRTLPPTPPLSLQDEISERWAGTFAVQFEEDQAALPIIVQPPPPSIEDDLGQQAIAALPRFIEEDQPPVPIITSLPPVSIEDELAQRWSATTVPAVIDDWYATAPLPPFVFEDDLRLFTADARAFNIEEDFPGKLPIPPIILTTSDDEASQLYVDWNLGYARFGIAMNDFDSHILPPIVPGPFVLIAALRHATYSALVASGGMKTYSALQASGGMKVVG